MLIVVTVVIAAMDLFTYLSHNGKRIFGVACAFICFFVNSSFITYSDTNQDVSLRAEGSTAAEGTTGEELSAGETADPVIESEAVTLVNNMNEEVILDDNDVLDGYVEDENIYYDEDVDTYTIDEILEENEGLYDNASDYDEAVDYEDYDFDPSDWRYVLINKQHPIPDDYTFTLGTIKGTMQCDERILDSLLGLLQGAKEDGVNIVVCSPYRDYYKQQVLFERKINAYMNKGYSYLEAYKLTSQTVTVPGASEHQIGLAIDFISDTYKTLDYGFGESEAGVWLREHSYEYGFILRYPQGQEYVTGIDYEPWHFRYVGVEAATVITQNAITLEDFTENYLN